MRNNFTSMLEKTAYEDGYWDAMNEKFDVTQFVVETKDGLTVLHDIKIALESAKPGGIIYCPTLRKADNETNTKTDQV